MRHRSERVKGKNYRPLGGMPLFHHVVRALQASGSIDQIVIDTDSPTIRANCAAEFPSVLVVERPAHLRDEMTPMNDVLLHTIDQVPADIYLQTHSTNPLLSSETIETAIAKFRAIRDRNDSLFGVTRLQQRLWSAMGEPINHDPNLLMRTQDLAPVFVENSCLYIFTAKSIRESRNRIGRTPAMFEIDRIEAHDIDEEADFTLAEMLFEQMKRKEKAA